MGARVAVAGASGYAGGELLRLLAGHPDVELTTVTAESSAGRGIAEVHPNLAGVPAFAGRRFEPATALRGLDCDLAFLALPAGQSAQVAAALPAGIRVVDVGPDFRIADPAAWARHYPPPHPGCWTCGLPELPGARRKIAAASRVAAPGCYATAVILALAPLLAAAGTSGAGRVARAELLGSEVMGSASAYQTAGRHRHIPEIEQALGAAAAGRGPVTVSLTPVLAPMPRGILATCTARLASSKVGTGDLRGGLASAYDAEPFVTVLPEERWPATGAVAGSNAVHLQAAADLRAGRAVVVCAIDNLGKGAAGQAIQNANLMLHLPETAGLTACGTAP